MISDFAKQNIDNSVTIKQIKKKINRSRSHRAIKKPEPFVVPGPATYDVRGKIELSKGFNFGGRHEVKNMKNNYAPPYLYIESDIDLMLKQPKFA